MDSFEKLIQKAIDRDCRLLFRFDPLDHDESWSIKFYPEATDNAHFYAYNNDLENAARQLLDELKGFEKW